jgi:hypothetical protein
MLKLRILDYDDGTKQDIYGEVRDLEQALLKQFPDLVNPSQGLEEMLEILNAQHFHGLKVYDLKLEQGSNQLPADYATADQGDDPWVRAADLKGR